MFITAAWYVAAWSSEIEAQATLSRRLLDRQIVLFRQQDGTPAALDDRCCHRFAPLSHGRLEGDCLRCRYHGLLFDARGVCVEVPGQTQIAPTLKVRSYPVAERDGFVWVWMGDAAQANPAEIHDAHWQVDPEWTSAVGGYIHYQSGHQLIADNLLDFSHLAYVHGQSIGSSAFAQQKPDVERGEGRLTIRHAMKGIARPPFLTQLSNLPEKIDRSNYYDWHVKGNFFTQDTVVSPSQTGDRDSNDPLTVRLRTIIALTPETPDTTHYFWSTTHNNFSTSQAGITAKLSAAISSAFDEDRVIIDAQQRVIDDRGADGMIAIAADGPLFQVRRMVQALIEAEGPRAELGQKQNRN